MNILVVSPSFIPDANVGKLRMSSLVSNLKDRHDITVIQNEISSYASITDEPPIEEVHIEQVAVSQSFWQDAKRYKTKIKECLQENNFDVVLISVGPFYTLPLAAFIKKLSNIPVVIDYRDLWTKTFRANEKNNFIKQSMKTFLIEKPALKKADAITVCAQGEIEVLVNQYPFLKNKKKTCIFNGFDDVKLEGISTEKEGGSREMVIGIYGKFESYIGLHNIDWLIESLKEFNSSIKETLRIIHYGGEEKIFAKKLRDAAIKYDWRGFVDYKLGMEALAKEADLFMAANDVMIGYGTKLFDYIYLNRPIVMYALEGSDLHRTVNGFENGFTFSKKEELDKALNTLYQKEADYLDKDINASEYSRSKQNKCFEEFLSSIIIEKKGA